VVIKIFQNKSKGLSEINEIGGKKPFDYEKMIQTLVEKNIETIFPELEFVFTEFPLDELRIDSVAFNKESNSFVILEYKNIKHGGVIDQGMAYLDLLEDKREAFVLLYNNEKRKSLKMDDVEWDESKVIIIATEFTPHQLRSANRTKDPIELYQIARFEDGIITLQKIQKNNDTNIKSKSKTKQIVRLGEYSEEDYLAGKYYSYSPPTEIGKKLFKIIKNKILDAYPDLEVKQKSKYVGFYSLKDGSAVCTIVVVKNKMELCYSIRTKDALPKSNFVRYMVRQNGKKIGHWGLGDYMSKIINEKDIEKSIPLIGKVYDIKVK
jgi:predicted transport protein